MADAQDDESRDTGAAADARAEPHEPSAPADAAVPVPDADLTARPAAASTPDSRQGSTALGRFLALLLGGAIAAGGGFGLAAYGVQQGWPMLKSAADPSSAETGKTLAALQAEVSRLDAALRAAAETPAPASVDLGPLEQRLAALESRPAGGGGVTDQALQQRLSELEQKIVAVNPADTQAITRQIDAQVAARMAEVTAEAEKAKAAAATARQAVVQEAAVVGLRSALESGIGLPEALAAVTGSGLALPDVLVALEAKPVSLSALRAGFPAAARAALTAERNAAQASGTMSERLKTFVMNQTGARPLTPQEGDSPEAILSRMQASIDAGDLEAAHQMLPSLPELARGALAGWAGDAGIYLSARQALAGLVAQE